MTKKELRQLIRSRKALCLTDERERLSLEICQRVQETPQWQDAKVVLLYHALPDEVNTKPLLNAIGKRILLPVVVGDDLEVREYDGTTSEGAFHIQEPMGNAFTNYDQIDLAIIPGMAFDHAGHRLGRGKGYYDRLLPRLSHAYRLGICFPFQLLNDIPCESHDITMHEVIGRL